MLHIKYKLKESSLHGIGLFTQEKIAKGRVVYTASPLLDLNITNDQFSSLQENERQEVQYYGFWDEPNNVWHVDFDVSRFINHSFQPTVIQDSNHNDAYLVATRDIESGEELTQNYLDFETKEDLQKRGIKADL